MRTARLFWLGFGVMLTLIAIVTAIIWFIIETFREVDESAIPIEQEAW